MIKTDKLSNLKTMLDISDTTQDNLLNMYLNVASTAILQRVYPYETKHVSEVPDKYDYLQLEIAVYLYNKRGAEGETAHSENGINRTYESADIPESLLGRAVPFAGVVV